jgi:hypothetical protein
MSLITPTSVTSTSESRASTSPALGSPSFYSQLDGRGPELAASGWLQGCLAVLGSTHPERCTVAPSPELADKIKGEMNRLAGTKRIQAIPTAVRLGMPSRPGLNDGLIIPGSHFPLGTSLQRVRSAAADSVPLHGTVRVIVVLVDFADQAMGQSRQHFEDLFFSTGVLADGSVKEYFDDVTNGLVSLTGEVVGPYRMPQDVSDDANGSRTPRCGCPRERHGRPPGQPAGRRRCLRAHHGARAVAGGAPRHT